MPETLTGACLCGGVRYEIEAGGILSAGYCHCTRCQRRTGAGASANGRLAPGALRVTHGAQLVTTWAPEDGAPKSFCSRCGGALWSGTLEEPGGVRLGTLDGDPGLRPAHRQYVAYAAPWEPLPDDGLRRYPEAPGDA